MIDRAQIESITTNDPFFAAEAGKLIDGNEHVGTVGNTNLIPGRANWRIDVSFTERMKVDRIVVHPGISPDDPNAARLGGSGGPAKLLVQWPEASEALVAPGLEHGPEPIEIKVDMPAVSALQIEVLAIHPGKAQGVVGISEIEFIGHPAKG